MLIEFVEFIKKEKLFLKKDIILIAVSGGADSVAMCRLFKAAGFKFAIAHCNFNLRAEESEADEEYVKNLAMEMGVAFYTTKFETAHFAKENGLSIQMAARKLRYNWFEKIRLEHKFNFIATAHHQDDIIETFFINLIRGTGISGLHGILPKNGFLIRPLLFTSKDQILKYCTKNKIKFQEDSSNSSIKYVRNKLRHQLIPIIKEINPSFKETLASNIEHFKFVENIYNNHLAKKAKLVVKLEEDKVLLSIKEIEKLDHRTNYLFEFLKSYDFNYSTVEDISISLNNISGKVFYSHTHRLLKDRRFLLVEKIKKTENIQIIIKENTKKIKTNLSTITFKKSHIDKEKKANIIKDDLFAYLDFDKLKFPLTIRRWQKGDWFYPLGMKSKKKLSDFFIDKKISLFEKENILVMCSGRDIVWIIGHRINNQYKIVQETKNMYIAQIL